MLIEHRKYSWRHEIISNDVLQEVPTTLKALIAQNSASSRLAHCTDDYGFTYPIFNINVPPRLQIDMVIIRSSLRYLVSSSNYVFEVAMYRCWNGPQLKAVPVASHFGASVYGTGWNQEMTPPDSVKEARNWDDELDNFFSSTSKRGLTGFSDFVATVEKVEDFLNSV